MKSAFIEPGLLRVFRWYAGLCFALYLLAGMRFLLLPNPSQRIEFDPLPYLGLTLMGMAILLIYLSIPSLQQRMGRVYLPLGIILAGSSLILERLFAPCAADLVLGARSILLCASDPGRLAVRF